MLTIKDIAKKAEVSVATVSKVMNGYDDIGEITKAKVLKIIKENNYRPNANAQSLRTNKSFLVGLFFKDHQDSGVKHPFFRGIISGLEERLLENNYDMILFSANWEDQFSYLEKCQFRNVDGAILMGVPKDDPKLPELLNAKIPSVFIDLDISDDKASYIISDNEKGAREAVRHLAELGHKKIAVIEGEEITIPTQKRLAGYKAEMKAQNLEIKDEWIIQGRFSVDGGVKAMEKILKLEDRPTAIFCMGDEIAVGAMQTIKEAGLNVPDDFSIVGFDDIEISQYLNPALTTIRQQKDEMGIEAANMVLEMINNPEKKVEAEIIDTEFVLRNSTKKL
ncbi:regulatory protein, LacI:Periplasmic binding protein/LacI transcriptional regulator [Halanaerobium saccharolyticum subsp. saccharolyticum DSM 6643]|uniref:Regulatory protein, LacI:Periplasmic binding protein/LacI transcriptional regulator n=1 Tax=Halanaerobium saccharolyticum subsp. saccharolyticum DSM 6643 TaxID=1293054 RepID=M5E3V5_9FIRM|nr:LacI family DNA-binding transcriptional regulator [Halanaerobium saccharolyticum]CCU81007.1 regulatory protein, LacI:Periplasmic binding protein/LacI transcriptional regulator [Halanaerobium saccharolyticum subsp. saccharolyticum DSM 6643]